MMCRLLGFEGLRVVFSDRDDEPYHRDYQQHNDNYQCGEESLNVHRGNKLQKFRLIRLGTSIFTLSYRPFDGLRMNRAVARAGTQFSYARNTLTKLGPGLRRGDTQLRLISFQSKTLAPASLPDQKYPETRTNARFSKYYAASRLARLRSCSSKKRLRIRIVFGVISTNSSSSINSIALSSDS